MTRDMRKAYNIIDYIDAIVSRFGILSCSIDVCFKDSQIMHVTFNIRWGCQDAVLSQRSRSRLTYLEMMAVLTLRVKRVLSPLFLPFGHVQLEIVQGSCRKVHCEDTLLPEKPEEVAKLAEHCIF